MYKKMDKKQTLLLIISCALCLALGLALGYGIRTQNLAGTAALAPGIPSAVATSPASESLYQRLVRYYTDRQLYYHEQMTALIKTFRETSIAAEADGVISEDENAALGELMKEMQKISDKHNETNAIIASLLSRTGKIYEDLMKGQ